VLSPLSHQHVARQFGCEVLAAQRVGLDHLHAVAADQLAREPQPHLAAAGDHHPAHRLVAPGQRVEHAADVLRRREHEDLVAGLNARGAVADDLVVDAALVGAVDRDETHVDVGHQLRQFGDDVAHHRAAADRAHGDEADASVGELEHLQRLRVLDQLAHIARDRRFRADHRVDREPLARDGRHAVDELGRAQPRDRGRDVEQVVRQLAGDEVGFVEWRAGDQHVGVVRSGGAEHRRMDAVAGDAA